MNHTDDPYALTLETLEERVKNCTKCPLGETRTHVVFGAGKPQADLMLIGEGPGEVEDNTGHPFVGPAGHKLDDVLASVGISR
ncbi:MAG: uracil-DNA glycosylase family protein, partial [Candidatus Bipolaricaulota bacterium]|nr:uracil-DNA glycosylase family protein [Candidatus Bipolaricaulota bacterium]